MLPNVLEHIADCEMTAEAVAVSEHAVVVHDGLFTENGYEHSIIPFSALPCEDLSTARTYSTFISPSTTPIHFLGESTLFTLLVGRQISAEWDPPAPWSVIRIRADNSEFRGAVREDFELPDLFYCRLIKISIPECSDVESTGAHSVAIVMWLVRKMPDEVIASIHKTTLTLTASSATISPFLPTLFPRDDNSDDGKPGPFSMTESRVYLNAGIVNLHWRDYSGDLVLSSQKRWFFMLERIIHGLYNKLRIFDAASRSATPKAVLDIDKLQYALPSMQVSRGGKGILLLQGKVYKIAVRTVVQPLEILAAAAVCGLLTPAKLEIANQTPYEFQKLIRICYQR